MQIPAIVYDNTVLCQSNTSGAYMSITVIALVFSISQDKSLMSSYSERMADQDVVPHDEYGEENQLQEFFKFVREYFEMEQKWDEVQQFGTEHPLASVFLIVTMAMSAVPITLFALFIMGSVAVSVTGFLFFEGENVKLLTLNLPNKLLSAKFLICFNFQSASMSLKVGENVV